MGLFKKFSQQVLGTKNNISKSRKTDNMRRCHFEVMEPRRVLSADPVIAGITYLEGDVGQDTTPDYFEVTFEGGAETTQLTQFMINGDQDLSGGLSDGDMLFDIGSGLPGTGGHHAFQFDAGNSVGITASDIRGISIGEDGLSLTVDVDNFEAGDIFAFTIDVDEVERFRTDKIASGVEFEGSFFNAEFVDENYDFRDLNVSTDVELENNFVQSQQEGIFYDYYDQLFATGSGMAQDTLQLTGNNEDGFADRTAGAIDAMELVPKPITISGTVYHDENLNCEHDADESGIGSVQINLQKMNDNGQYETVASTTTDALGNYEFGADLGLTPGTYRLVEFQPNGFLDVGAEAGTVDGTVSGQVEDDSSQNANIISDINIPLGGTAATDYDFKEVRPASLSGNVWHDRNDDGVIDPGEEGIADVLIRVTRVGAKDGVSEDPFAGTESIFVRTDANGHYSVDSLPPGIYEVVQVNNYPNGNDPLAPYIDGKDSVGNVDGTTIGSKVNDKMSQVILCAGDDGVEYNFGELKPAEISGFVSITTPDGDCLDPSDPNHVGIAGVTIELFDSNGQLVASTLTNSQGRYEFDDLAPGTYTIVEVQPDGYLDGGEHVGEVDRNSIGQNTFNDRFTNVTVGSESVGQNYNFCEHIPAEICGTVYHDRNDNGVQDAGEEGIEGVIIQLFDESGNVIAEQMTDANGDYCFEDLYAGEYCVKEFQPGGFVDGRDSLGTIMSVDATEQHVGEMSNDEFCGITLRGGDQGMNYDFGEIKLGSISGMVHADANGDCVFDASEGDRPLEGVTLILFDDAGNEVERTLTDANGMYSFDSLRPGEYSVREFTPDGYLDGDEMMGTVDGTSVGQLSNDRISSILLSSGDEGVNYDFCEHIPAEICGTVYHDRNNNGIQDAGEEGIEGTRVVLYDADGNMVADVFTDANGDYCFEDLIAGEYCIKEMQPDSFIDGQDTLGAIGAASVGTQRNDEFCNVEIRGGERGTEYNFGELRTAEISGFVHLDPNNDCVFDISAGDEAIAGVTMELLDVDGNVIASTVTDANGYYEFTNVLPGEYSVRQIQPDSLFTTGESIGDGGGNADENIISGIMVESGQKVEQYNFCENEAAEIHGRVWEDGPAFQTEDGNVPENYRDLRDGVYQEGVDTPIAGVRMTLHYFVDPVAGEIAPRAVTYGEVMPEFYAHMGENVDPNTPVWVETMADGEYWFQGLQPGNYIVLQEQPDDYTDANDIPGTTQGFTFNSANEAETANVALLSAFSTNQLMDSVAGIVVTAGDVSIQNNFTEVRAQSVTTPDENRPDPSIPRQPPQLGNPLTPRPGLTGLPGLFGSMPGSSTQFIGTAAGAAFEVEAGGGGVAEYTWHLSVINGGQPRAVGESLALENGEGEIWQLASHLNDQDWSRFDMTRGHWSFAESNGELFQMVDQGTEFGMIGGTPLAGDFDGDGTDEVAIYKDGYWFIDINKNGRWDDADLIAKLGDQDDRPVVGDWDGDGKDDIGIYGPIWELDHEAIARDPGLPNPENDPFTKPKNIPPVVSDATNGARTMKLTSYGQQRADVVDHVFGTGEAEDVPVTGDWNGNGIRSIGTFTDGVWHLDINGDGKFDLADKTAQFGQAGDIPLVGDFNGDGIEQIAIYRSGTWIIDSNGNREIDAADKTFEMGGATDQPVVGDWNGDGVDEPGLYNDGQGRIAS